MVATDASGLSGGLAVLWDPSWIQASAFKCYAGILISASIRGQSTSLKMLNIYAPCRDRSPFWDRLFESELLDMDSVMLAGDFNVTLNADEVWGAGRAHDRLGDRIRKEFLHRKLIDIPQRKRMPTWDNKRIGTTFIAKRIDRFVIKADIIEEWGMPLFLTGEDGSSDHRPILLIWKEVTPRFGYSFKFNRAHLEEQEYNDIIKNKWTEIKESDMALYTTFREKIHRLKMITKDWQIRRKRKMGLRLAVIKRQLRDVLESSSFDGMSMEHKAHIFAIEKEKQKILKEEEAVWRLKSRVLWLKQGDRNTKSFNKVANTRRNINSIWLIKNEKGESIHSQEVIYAEAVKFFQNQYSRRQSNIEDSLWAVEYMPEMFDGQANDEFFRPITEEELHSVMKSFKKDKSPGPDG